MTDMWVVNWVSVEGRDAIRGASGRYEQKSFDSEKEAFSYAVGLPELSQESAQLRKPDGSVVDIAVIRQMHDAQQAKEKRETD